MAGALWVSEPAWCQPASQPAQSSGPAFEASVSGPESSVGLQLQSLQSEQVPTLSPAARSHGWVTEWLCERGARPHLS